MKDELLNKLRQLSESELYAMLYHDSLTRVLNRRAFDESKSQIVALIDLDSLKYINDTEGHRMGDAYLYAMGRHLIRVFDHENVYRISGDEFAVRGDSVVKVNVGLNRVRSSFPGFSFGIGKDLSSADTKLIEEKQGRECTGLRAKRGEIPPWVVSKQSSKQETERNV